MGVKKSSLCISLEFLKYQKLIFSSFSAGFQMCSKLPGVITLQGTDGDKSSEWQRVTALATGSA